PTPARAPVEPDGVVAAADAHADRRQRAIELAHATEVRLDALRLAGLERLRPVVAERLGGEELRGRLLRIDPIEAAAPAIVADERGQRLGGGRVKTIAVVRERCGHRRGPCAVAPLVAVHGAERDEIANAVIFALLRDGLPQRYPIRQPQAPARLVEV